MAYLTVRQHSIFVLFFLGLLLPEFTAAQGIDAGKGTRLQDTRIWEEQIPITRKALQTSNSPELMEKLADCYRMTGDLGQAEAWYEKAIENGHQSSLCLLNYAKSLQGNGKYEEARDQFNRYEAIAGNTNQVRNYISSCEYAIQLKGDRSGYEIQPVSRLNTPHSDMIAINSREEILFATRGKRREIGNAQGNRQGSSDYDLYIATRYPDGSIEKVRPVTGGANSRYDDLAAVRMPGTDLLLFTRSGKPTNDKRKTVGAREYTDNVRIVTAQKNGRRIGQMQHPMFNFADGNSNFYPAVHPSGNMIVFASDRHGGFGGADLYMTLLEDGKWSKPVNLGPAVNTEGNELFPTFNQQGHLFFSSEGHIGLGGLDLFMANFEDGTWQNTTNMGAGINSPKDDFGIVWDVNKSSGYFNSNRNVSTGDDIYHFKRVMSLKGQVKDRLTGEPLPGCIVRIKDANGNEKIIISDGAGQFAEPCRDNSGYLIAVDAPGFHSWRDTLWTKDVPQGRDMDLDVKMAADLMFELKGYVHDKTNGERLGNTRIEICQNGAVQKTLSANEESADYRLKLTPGEEYSIIFRKEAYVPKIINVSLAGFRGVESRTSNVPMSPGDHIMVHGVIREGGSANSPMSQASVNIIDNLTQAVVDSATSLNDGSFWVAIPWHVKGNYSIIAAKKGFFAASKHIDRADTKEMTMDLSLSDGVFGLDHSVKVIKYGYDKTDLDLISKQDLNEIYFFLTKNPEAKLEIRSHTDSRGSSAYNLELSRRRSEAVVRFIQDRRPLSDDRFAAWGFGEEYLINRCADSVPCSEEEHAANRRTEIKIIE